MIRVHARLCPPQPGVWIARRIQTALPRALQAAMNIGLKTARARLAPGGGGPLSRSGRLARSITAKVVGLGGGRWKGELSAAAPYAGVHEFGATIRARNRRYLTFQVHGRWVRKPQVRIPPRPFLRPALAASARALGQALVRELER